MDKIILGNDCVLLANQNNQRPNDNVLVEGPPGVGKSCSNYFTTIINTNESSMIVVVNKPEMLGKLMRYMSIRGYNTEIIDLTDPSRSTVTVDPLRYCKSYLDIEELSRSIVFADPDWKNPKDSYWNNGAIHLLFALIGFTQTYIENATTADVVNLFNSFKIMEKGKGITTSLDELCENVEMMVGKSPAVTAFEDICQLPYNTAGCLRDSLAKALRSIFPESIMKMMGGENLVDFEDLATKKTLLIIVTSPVNTSLHLFANLICDIAIKELLEFAERCPGYKLPRPVRLMFDDFACGSKINNFPKYISIFRSVGISTMILLQSESQLRQMYSEAESETIVNNCATYVYYPGGMDLITCKSISQRLDVPLTDVLYAPMGQVIVLRSGMKPVTVKRYDLKKSKEYQELLKMTDTLVRSKNKKEETEEFIERIRKKYYKNALMDTRLPFNLPRKHDGITEEDLMVAFDEFDDEFDDDFD